MLPTSLLCCCGEEARPLDPNRLQRVQVKLEQSLNTCTDLEMVNYGKPFPHPFTHDLRCMAKFSEETIELLLRNSVILKEKGGFTDRC